MSTPKKRRAARAGMPTKTNEQILEKLMIDGQIAAQKTVSVLRLSRKINPKDLEIPVDDLSIRRGEIMTASELRRKAEEYAAEDRGTDLWTIQKIINSGDNHPWLERIKDVIKIYEAGFKEAEKEIKEKLRQACFDGKTYTKRISFIDLIRVLK